MTDEEKAEAGKRERIKTDPRYNNGPGIICLHCKHLVSTGTRFDPEGWSCKAFPEEILYGILTNRNVHDEPFVSQKGEYLFEPAESHTEIDTGRKWHWNADGSWTYDDGKGGEGD